MCVYCPQCVLCSEVPLSQAALGRSECVLIYISTCKCPHFSSIILHISTRLAAVVNSVLVTTIYEAGEFK